MSWLYNLYQTYENCAGRIGDKTEKPPLVPIGHTTQTSTVEIIINSNADFLRAKAESISIITPCSEQSSGRAGSMISSHPIFDEFKYVAGDFLTHGGKLSDSFAKKGEELNNSYIELLSDWCNSKHSHPGACIVLKYIKKKSVISDLSKVSIIPLSADSKIVYSPATTKLLKGNIRFSIEMPKVLESHLWEDESLWQSWLNYYLNKKKVWGLCYAKGSNSLLAEQHPKKILPGEANAKLISANDTSGFTFRGRFIDDSQACNVGYEVTQKAHNALAWLIRRQGSWIGSQAVVAWSIQDCEVPSIMTDTLSLVLGTKATVMDEESTFNAGQNIGTEFRKLITGYKGSLGNTDNVIVMALDSMTSGRAAIKYYRELTGSEYLERIEHWHTQCKWRQRYSKDKVFVGAPAPKDIAKAAYGSKVDDNLLKATIERLLPCIVDKSTIPRDILQCCLNNMHRRQAFELWEWEKNLGITCALYQYKHIEKDYKMALEEKRNTRDYLYGRLLAIAESIEKIALASANENRPTNAERLMQRFADKPFTTWRNIELALSPSRQRLKVNRPGFLVNRETDLISVKNLFKPEDFCNDTKLTGEFLLGYDCQRSELPPWKKTEKQCIDDNNNQNYQ